MSQHRRCCDCADCCPSDAPVDAYTNVSQVANPDETEGAPATIDPYPRADTAWDETCGDPNTPLCGPWPKDERPQEGDITGDQVFHQDNILVPTGTTVDLSQCIRIGQKIVQARKWQQGRLQLGFCAGSGFNPPEAPGTYPTPIAARRFRTVERTATVNYVDADDIPQAVTWESSVTSNRYSGVQTGTASADPSDIFQRTAQICARIEPGAMSQGTEAAFYWPDFHCGFNPTVRLEDVDAAPWLYALASLATGMTWDDLDTNVPGGGIGATDGSGSGSFTDTTATAECSFSYTDTTSTVTSISVTITLSNEYTAAMVRDDLVTMLAAWSLTNNNVLPWRGAGDAYRTVGVLMEYDEAANNHPPDNWSDGYEDPNALLFDGSLKGSPFTLGWPDRLFGFEQKSWLCDGGWFVQHWGQWAPVTNIPNTATRWTDREAAPYLPDGAYIWNPMFGLVYSQKTVEAKVAIGSYNLFGPCGAQRYTMDTRFASCISLIDGNVITTTDDLSDGGRPNGAASWGLAVIIGGDLGGKVFNVDSTGTNEITLGTEVVTNGNVGDAFSAWSGDLGLGIIGVVRWPSVPAICAKVSISSAEQDGADVKCFAAVPYLVADDVVSFVANDASDTSLLASQTVTAVDLGAGWFKVAGTYAGNEALYAQAVKSSGAPLASWYSTTTRGNYIVETFAQDGSTFGFSATPTITDGNIPYDICGAGIAVTPNGDYEADPTWNHFTFPPEVTFANADSGAGVKVVQRVIDPTWQAPLSCGDSGGPICPPYVEAMSDAKHDGYVTSGAAAMPGDTAWSDVIPVAPPTPPGSSDCETGLQQSDVPWRPAC